MKIHHVSYMYLYCPVRVIVGPLSPLAGWNKQQHV